MKTIAKFNWSAQGMKNFLLLTVSILFMGTSNVNAQCAGFTVSPDVTICEGESTTLTAAGAFLHNVPGRYCQSRYRRGIWPLPQKWPGWKHQKPGEDHESRRSGKQGRRGRSRKGEAVPEFLIRFS